MKSFKFDKKTIVSLVACVFAAAMAIGDEISKQKNENELDELKERVAKLEGEEES